MRAPSVAAALAPLPLAGAVRRPISAWFDRQDWLARCRALLSGANGTVPLGDLLARGYLVPVGRTPTLAPCGR